MAVSQNGYPANDPTLVSSRLVPGTTRKLTVRKGPAGDLLLWVAAQFDKRVEDIEQGILDDWGYAERPIRGGTELSNHASGTAIDLNATSHPLATDPPANFTQAEIDEIHEIIGQTQGCVRWGGDYTGRKDGMHFEIVRDETTCARALAALTQKDWFGMTTQQEFEAAVGNGVFSGLGRYIASKDAPRFNGRNFGDKAIEDTRQAFATNAKLDQLITTQQATNAKLDTLITLLTPKAPQ